RPRSCTRSPRATPTSSSSRWPTISRSSRRRSDRGGVNMNRIDNSRRRFAQAIGSGSALGILGAGGVFGLAGCAVDGAPAVSSGTLGRVLVIGGGFGGATAAKYLKKWGGDGVQVTLVER